MQYLMTSYESTVDSSPFGFSFVGGNMTTFSSAESWPLASTHLQAKVTSVWLILNPVNYAFPP